MSVRRPGCLATKVEDQHRWLRVSYFNRLAVVDASGADVNCGGGEATHIGEQVRFGVMCEVVGLGDAEGRIGGAVDFCSKGVADPADAEFADLSYALDGSAPRARRRRARTEARLARPSRFWATPCCDRSYRQRSSAGARARASAVMSASGGRCAPDRGLHRKSGYLRVRSLGISSHGLQVAIGGVESAPRSLAGGDDLIHSA